MAKFYGEIDGRRGYSVHRLGDYSTTVRAASWKGGVETTLYEDDDGSIRCRIETIMWNGAGKHTLLYDGPLADMFEASPARPLYEGASASVSA